MEQKSEIYTQHDLLNVLKGACLLASGGGGTYQSAKGLVDLFKKGDYYLPHGETPVCEVIKMKNAVQSGSYAVVVAYMGAPEALSNVSYPNAVVSAVKEIQKYLEGQNKKLEYLVPVETGPLGLCVPCLVANKMGLKVIDCDGAGRAVPELTMLTFSAECVPVNPTVLSNSKDFYVQLNIGDESSAEHQESAAETIENLTRPMLGLQQFNEIAGLAMWIMGPAEMEKAIEIENTMDRAKSTGEMVSTCDNDKIITYLKDKQHLKAYKMFQGQFVDEGCGNITKGGFDYGKITIKNDTGQFYTGIFRNETLLAWDSSKPAPIAMAPDSIAYYVDDEQKVYSNGDIIGSNGKLVDHLKNKQVTAIGIASNDILRKNEEQKLNSPIFIKRMAQNNIMKSFKKALLDIGYAGPYVKIEDIWKK